MIELCNIDLHMHTTFSDATDTPEEIYELVKEAGVEAFYSGYTTMLCEEMLAFADRYCLYVTAGSDYHGKNKSVVIGDTGPKMVREMPNGMKQFLKTIRI